MASEGHRPTASELAELEHAFASDPSSDAWKSLAEAYRSLGRYMEAMVVAKKGIRTRPDDPMGRVLLARVYQAQGKVKKAIQELEAGADQASTHAETRRLLGHLLMEQGDVESGRARLTEAARLAPADPDVQTSLERWGVPAPTSEAAPAPVAPPASPEASTWSAPSMAPEAPREGPPVLDPEPDSPEGMAPPAPTPAAQPAVEAPRPRPAAAHRPAARAVASVSEMQSARRSEAADELDDLDDFTVPTRGKGSLRTTLVVLAVGAVALAGFSFWFVQKANRDQEISDLLKVATEQLARDNYAAFQEASKTLEQVLDLDPDQFAAHAYLAYINVLRWGEHGEGETFHQQALQHLEAAQAHDTEHAYLIAAEAWARYYGGDPAGGIARLREVLDRPGVNSTLLATALGQMLTGTGNYEDAQKRLVQAQQFTPGQPRILAALGECYRREGRPPRAMHAYDQALSFDPEHVDSLLGKALLILDTPQYADEQASPLVDQVLALGEERVSPRQRAIARFAKAQVFYAEGKAAEARKAEEQALTLQPANPDLHAMMGRRLARQGDFAEAASALERAIELDPGRAGLRIDLAKVYLDWKGHAAQAVAALEAARKALPEDTGVLVLLGEAQAAAGNRDDAVATWQTAIEKSGGKEPGARLAMGRMYREQKNWSEASKALTTALETWSEALDARGQARAQLELARLAFDRGQEKLGREKLIAALEADPSYPDTLFFLGRIYASGRRTRKEAREALQGYLARDPTGEWADEAKALLGRL